MRDLSHDECLHCRNTLREVQVSRPTVNKRIQLDALDCPR